MNDHPLCERAPLPQTDVHAPLLLSPPPSGPTGLGTSAARIAGRFRAGTAEEQEAGTPETDCRQRLADFLAGQVAPDGRLVDFCQSRILETALLLQLLRAEDTDGATAGEQEALRGYLEAASPPDEGNAIIRDAALGSPDVARAARFRATFTHTTGARKQILLGTVFSLFGLVPMADLPTVAAYRGQAAWTEMVLCANNILGSHARGEDAVEDQAFLVGCLTTGLAGRPWHGNVLAHLIALHALRTFQPKGPLLAAGITAVSGTRRPDGGVPFIGSQDVYLTAMAGIALAAVGDKHDVVARMADWLAGVQLPDGGWGYCTETTQTDVDDTSRCVELLRAVGPHRYRTVIAAAEDYLVAMAGPEGGFPTYLAGHPSEPDMTAGAVIALSADWDRHAGVLDAAVGYLLDQSRDDGTYELSWTLSESSVICHVLDALERAPGAARDERIQRAVNNSVVRLCSTQNDDGGWGRRPGDPSDVLSTAQAIASLARSPQLAALHRAGRWLRAQQRTDGRFSSIPDQAGPRPHPYDYPSLASIHTLNALNALAAADPSATTPQPRTHAAARPSADATHSTDSTGQSGRSDRLPEFYCPFPSAEHPRADEFDRRSIAWMHRYGLCANDEERARTAQIGVGRFAARVAPRARDDLRQILSDFVMWIFAFDDECCDEGALRGRPGELAEAMGRIHRCGEVIEEPLYEDDRYGMSLHELRTRLWSSASPAESDRFIQAMRGYFQVEATKAGFLAREQQPDLDAFTLTSIQSGGALALAGLAGAINCADTPPPQLLNDRSAHAITELASTIAAWINSIISIPKERERAPDGFNPLDAIRTETACAEDAAIDQMMLYLDRMTTLFVRQRERLAQRRPDLTDYLEGLEYYLSATVDWSFTSNRYLYTDGRGGKPAFQPSGRRDTPRDHSTEPLPIPSIAWWWRHDPDSPHVTPNLLATTRRSRSWQM